MPADGPVTLLTDSSADLDRAREQAVCDRVELASDLGASDSRPAARLLATVGLTGLRVLPAPAMECAPRGGAGAQDLGRVGAHAELRMREEPGRGRAPDRGRPRLGSRDGAPGSPPSLTGAREVEMAAAAEHAIRAAGAELSFTTVAGAGPRTALGTFLPGDRPMRSGDAVVLDCGARVHGYHGDMCRTVAVGEPSPELERALEAVAAAVEAGTAAARPGARRRRPARGGARRSRRRRPRRGVVGRVHAARRRHRPARAALRRPRPGVRAPGGDGAVHRARRPPARRRPASSTSR